jgi:hypothetical protein
MDWLLFMVTTSVNAVQPIINLFELGMVQSMVNNPKVGRE